MRSSIIGAIAAIALASVSQAAVATGHDGGGGSGKVSVSHAYQWDDARKRCRDEQGRLVAAGHCAPPRHAKECDPAKAKPCGDTCIALNKVCQHPAPRWGGSAGGDNPQRHTH